jgi:hypothetical protein
MGVNSSGMLSSSVKSTCLCLRCHCALQDAVTVVGYPIGGDTMSVTSGVVSRIEVTSYVHGAAELLGIQIDAAVSLYGC